MAKRIVACMFLVVLLSLAILTVLGMKKIPHKPVQPAKAERLDEVRESSMRILVEEIPIKSVPVSHKEAPVKHEIAKGLSKEPKVEKIPIMNVAVIRKEVSVKREIAQGLFEKPKNDPEAKPDAGRLRLSPDLIVSGQGILKDGNKVPLVFSSYQKIGFKEYIRKMKEIGGRFFVGDAASGEIIAEAFIDENNLSLHHLDRDFKKSGNYDNLALSRPREIVNETLSQSIVNRVINQTGTSGDLRFVVILPANVEAGILGALKQFLASTGYPISSFETISGQYYINGNSLVLRIEKGTLGKTGESLPLKMDLEL